MDVTGAINVVSISDVGRHRPLNEDSVDSNLVNGLLILADGMGGHNCGEVASEMATLVIKAELANLFSSQQAIMSVSDMLEAAVMLANKTIKELSEEQVPCEGMGTTLVTGVFVDNTIVIGHIGDSRMYRLRGDDFVQLTEDHSVLQEQINAGLITKEDARHANNAHLVTRALGTNTEVALALSQHEVNVDDVYLLCSDGLTDLVEDDEIKNTMINANGNMNVAAKALVDLANAYGGNDNISILIASVEKPFPLFNQ